VNPRAAEGYKWCGGESGHACGRHRALATLAIPQTPVGGLPGVTRCVRGAARGAQGGSAYESVGECVCVCVRARSRLGCGGQRDSGRPVGDRGAHRGSVAAGSICKGDKSGRRVVPRAQTGP
jgi:hypothetical protein